MRWGHREWPRHKEWLRVYGGMVHRGVVHGHGVWHGERPQCGEQPSSIGLGPGAWRRACRRSMACGWVGQVHGTGSSHDMGNTHQLRPHGMALGCGGRCAGGMAHRKCGVQLQGAAQGAGVGGEPRPLAVCYT